jgi:hypothetical protein
LILLKFENKIRTIKKLLDVYFVVFLVVYAESEDVVQIRDHLH